MDLKEREKITSGNFKRHPWELARFKVLEFFLEKVDSKQFIVDIGSGDAFVADRLSKRFAGSAIAAVDTNYNEKDITQTKPGNLVFLKKVDKIDPSQHIDLILLMDVLEHIEYPDQLLNELRSLPNVSSSTKFFITVPAFQSLFNEHDVFLKHFKRYNRKQVNQLLSACGFEIEKSGYFFFTLLMPRSFHKIFGLHQKIGLHNWDKSVSITSIITNLLWIDFKIGRFFSSVGINLPGLSCYCICHPLP